MKSRISNLSLRRKFDLIIYYCRLIFLARERSHLVHFTLLLFFSILTLTWPLAAQSPEANQSGKIPLERAIADALKISQNFRHAALEVDYLARQETLQAKEKLFNISFNGNYLYRSLTPVLELPFGSPSSTNLASQPAVSSPVRIEGGLKHNYDLSLVLRQPLFTGGQLSKAVELNRLQKLMATDQQSLLANQIITQVISSFYRYQLLQTRQNSALTLKKRLELHRQQLENLVKEELSRRANLLETLSKIEEIENSLLDLEQLAAEERLNFHRLTGHYPEEIAPQPLEPSLDLPQAMAFLEKNHPFLRQLDKQLTMINIQKKIIAGRYLPQLAALAEVHYGKPGINFFEKEWTLYFQGGISLNVPLFDWQKKNVEQEMLDLKARQIETTRENFLQDTKKSLASLYSQVEILQKKLSHLQKMVDYAREKRQLKHNLWQENLIPHLDYLTALSEEENYKWSIQEVNYQLLLTQVTINSLIGHYTEVSR